MKSGDSIGGVCSTLLRSQRLLFIKTSELSCGTLGRTVILTFQTYATIPEKKNLFYRQVFDALFSQHDSMSKLAFVREKQSGLNKEQIETVLKLFSFLSYYEEKFNFDYEYIANKFDQIKSRKKDLVFDNQKLINDLQIAIGILNKDGSDFTFPHRSLQEYFAANYVSSLGLNNKISFYEKVRISFIKTRITPLINKHNYFSLLIEMDSVDFSNNVTLPLLEEGIRKVKKTDVEDENMIYFIFGDVMVIYDLLRMSDVRFKNIEKELPVGEFTWYNSYEDTISNKGRINNMAQVKEAFFHFLKIGDVLVQQVKEWVNENDNSDSEILELISRG